MTGARSYTTKIWRQPSSIGFSSADALSTSMDPPGEPVISTRKRPCQKIQNGSEFPELVAQNSRNPQAGVSGVWGGQAHGRWTFGMLWGIPFVLIGQYLIWGRFLYAAWLKGRTHYAVTNRRVIVVQDGWKRQTASAYIDSLPSLVKEGGSNGIGILRFGQPQAMWSRNQGFGAWNTLSIGSVPTFVDIEDVDSVYRLVSDQRERARAAKPTF